MENGFVRVHGEDGVRVQRGAVTALPGVVKRCGQQHLRWLSEKFLKSFLRERWVSLVFILVTVDIRVH